MKRLRSWLVIVVLVLVLNLGSGLDLESSCVTSPNIDSAIDAFFLGWCRFDRANANDVMLNRKIILLREMKDGLCDATRRESNRILAVGIMSSIIFWYVILNSTLLCSAAPHSTVLYDSSLFDIICYSIFDIRYYLGIFISTIMNK